MASRFRFLPCDEYEPSNERYLESECKTCGWLEGDHNVDFSEESRMTEKFKTEPKETPKQTSDELIMALVDAVSELSMKIEEQQDQIADLIDKVSNISTPGGGYGFEAFEEDE